MNKLNFGCGTRFAKGWVNIDFHSTSPEVMRVNLLKGFPFPDNHFDAVYSSHVLEHFTKHQAMHLLRESRRVLKPQGILRIVVPDLAGTCEEYMRILALDDSDPDKKKLYDWIILELLDQLVRTVPCGEMGAFCSALEKDPENKELLSYVYSRTQNPSESDAEYYNRSFSEKLRNATWQQIRTKINYIYISCVKHLLPASIRSMVFVETAIGERHRWMYDYYGLKAICLKAGFTDCRETDYDQSAIQGFNGDFLDMNADGRRYKYNSLYLEAVKA